MQYCAAFLLFAAFFLPLPSRAAITVGPFVFDDAAFADNAVQLEEGLLLLWGGAADLNDALTGFSPTKGLANIGYLGMYANLFQLDFTDFVAVNGDGPDIVFFDARFSADPYAIAVREQGGSFTDFVDFPVDAFFYAGLSGPSGSSLYALPIDLNVFGLAPETVVDAIRFKALPNRFGNIEGDPVMAAVLNGVAAPAEHAPALSFSGEEGYGTDGVHPNKGTASSTIFTLKTIYTDEDNEAPSYIRAVVDGIAYTMSLDEATTTAEHLRDGIYANGEQYMLAGPSPKRVHAYHFEASDGIDTVRLPITSTLTFESGYSNVAFLPGHQASRLYAPGFFGEDKLWEPNLRFDFDDLKLSSTTAESVRPDIYTRDVIDEAYTEWQGFNVYKNFEEFMNEEVVGKGVIKEWKALPYDWRLDLDDLLANGRELGGGNISYLSATSTPYILQELRRLADTSASGKVTILTHSNGGLVAKYLLEKLAADSDPLLENIDKLIMVAAPQLGTPKAMEGLLHGDETQLGVQEWGIFLDEEQAREFGENMQSAYNLLPSREYFSRIVSPVVEFKENVNRAYDFRALYGGEIDSADELHRFLLGDNGARSEPAPNDEESPNVLKADFLSQAELTHDTILDPWALPPHIEVIQIAGWGLDTIRGIGYACGLLTCSSLSALDRDLLFTSEGDGTVVEPSATAMNVEEYYVNLPDYNHEGILNQRRNRDHSNILEVDPLQEFIKSVIQEGRTLARHISSTKPSVEDEDRRLRLRLHSPASLHLYDSEGNHTGPISHPDPNSVLRLYEARIPNSYHLEFDDTQYAGADTFATTTVVLIGEALGTFTFEVDEVLGDQLTASTTFADIPLTASTTATLVLRSVSDATLLVMDVDGDGTVDASIAPGKGVTLGELLAILKGIVKTLDLSDKDEKKFLKKIEKLEKKLLKECSNECAKKHKIAQVFQKLIRHTRKLGKKGVLTGEEMSELVEIVGIIEGKVVN